MKKILITGNTLKKRPKIEINTIVEVIKLTEEDYEDGDIFIGDQYRITQTHGDNVNDVSICEAIKCDHTGKLLSQSVARFYKSQIKVSPTPKEITPLLIVVNGYWKDSHNKPFGSLAEVGETLKEQDGIFYHFDSLANVVGEHENFVIKSYSISY
jgi:hypothetical protein